MLQPLKDPSGQHPSTASKSYDKFRRFRIGYDCFYRLALHLSPPSDKYLLAASTPHPGEPATTQTQSPLAALDPMQHEPSRTNMPPVMAGHIVRLCSKLEEPFRARLSQSQPQPATLEHSPEWPQYFAESPVEA